MNVELDALIQKAIDQRTPHIISGRPDFVLDGLKEINKLANEDQRADAHVIAEKLYSEIHTDTFFDDTRGYYKIGLSETLKQITEMLQ